MDTNTLIYNSLAEKMTIEQVEQTFSQMREWQLWGYLLIAILLFLKTHIVVAVLSIGTFVFEKEITYRTLWGLVLRAEFIFLIPAILKILLVPFFSNGLHLGGCAEPLPAFPFKYNWFGKYRSLVFVSITGD